MDWRDKEQEGEYYGGGGGGGGSRSRNSSSGSGSGDDENGDDADGLSNQEWRRIIAEYDTWYLIPAPED
jgi:hypothetical protein